MRRLPSPKQVVDRVAEWYHLAPEALIGPSKERYVVRAREVAAAVLITLCGHSGRAACDALAKGYTGRSTDLAARAARIPREELVEVYAFITGTSGGFGEDTPAVSTTKSGGIPVLSSKRSVTDKTVTEVVREESLTTRAVDDEFATLWALYPRKTARKPSLVAFRARRRQGVAFEELLAATRAYAQERAGEDERFTMHGSTFYGPNERWKEWLGPRPAKSPPKAPTSPLDGQQAAFYARLRRAEG